ncbi:PREDICTED: RING finger and transmembrane domain-containing protein 1 isoform X2 [Gekko japonicus]|uniref:E3 ubiquitin-protein ligase RNFT1 n=1 Tax=Gekko japonicus TaxID=146911 RepID=A0ABM1L738_GEKJA|nr:PREDICTED: RING finger and transmembrane domain-containing protein 1 isoform X2 [Gekko japonicus]
MKPRPRCERKHHAKTQAFGVTHNPPATMQAHSNNRHSAPGNNDAPQCAHAGRPPGEGSCQRGGDVHIQLNPATMEAGENAGSRQHPHSGIHSHSHSHSEARGPEEGGGDSEEHSGSSLSELRYLLQWLHKSLPYILILSVKLLLQHVIGISLGIGLLTTFMYANKSIVNQVFLREKCSRLHCAGLLLFLTGSSVLLYYTFYNQSLHYSLIFLSPTVDFTNFWEVLWIVGITDFVLKFLFMSFKCIVLLLPCLIMSFKAKLLSFFAHLKHFRWVLRVFYSQPSYGVAASKRQCADADDICSICQAEFQKPVVLICQHIFCEECIALWFNREKSCPLCRTVISDHINKWKDGASSVQLQIY